LPTHKTVLLSASALLLALCLLTGCADQKSRTTGLCTVIEGRCVSARTAGRYFEIYDGDQWQELIIKGVNIGTSLPGRWYTEFPADRQLYARWLEEIAALNANTIRIYTLLDPSFYAVLAEYNSNPENETLWLFQEIWPDDEVPGLDFYSQVYAEEYRQEIMLVIDALHGNADIPARSYRAYGNYSMDVSPYLLGLMIGRELEPEEVAATNEANPNLKQHQGSYVQTTGDASATEVWLAEMTDFTAAYCDTRYGRQIPVGFVSWPTLDPLTHLTEWEADGTPGYNDREVVDPNLFSVGPENVAGFFGAYHIYPNYPDLMNNEPAFASFSDQEGPFRYKGYLNSFMAIHPPYPAIVAEFGISTSLNTAHLNPEGLNHGGLSESDQGTMVVRMMQSIIDEGYAGGLIFEWSDEWAKKTWNTEPFMIPWERQVLWQNAMCPEQNYGLLAVEPLARPLEALLGEWQSAAVIEAFAPSDDQENSYGVIRKFEAGADEAYLYLAITLDQETTKQNGTIPWEEIGLAVGINNGIADAGEFRLPYSGLPELPGPVQFLLDLKSPQEALLLAIPSYNRGAFNFNPQPSTAGIFEPINALVNRGRTTAAGLYFPALFSNESVLNYGTFDPEADRYNSLAHWELLADGRVIIRLPWMLLNVADPSSGSVIRDRLDYGDLPLRDQLSIETGRGMKFYALTYAKDLTSLTGADLQQPAVLDFYPRSGDQFMPEVEPFSWGLWEEPLYQFRLKKSYTIIADYFKTIP
jgi:hypothetical protein